jgi:hypothetical protein
LPVAIGVAIGLELLSKPQESVVQGIVNEVLKVYDWRPNLTLFTTMIAQDLCDKASSESNTNLTQAGKSLAQGLEDSENYYKLLVLVECCLSFLKDEMSSLKH